MAAVFCASFRRRAMVWRRRVMRTRSSRAASSAPDGARGCTTCGGGRRGCDGAPLATASSTSPFSTWPRLPVPATCVGRQCCSRPAAWRRAGAGGIAALPRSAVAGELGGLAGGFLAVEAPAAAGSRCDCLGLGRGRRRSSASPASRQPPSAIAPSSAPTRDGLAVLGGDLGQHAGGRRGHFDRHLVGLELDQRLVGATASPTFLNHLPTVASVTDSPRVGTRISVPSGRHVSGCLSSRCLTSAAARLRGRPASCASASTSGRSPVEAEAGRPA